MTALLGIDLASVIRSFYQTFYQVVLGMFGGKNVFLRI